MAGAAIQAEKSFLAKSLKIGLEPWETCELRPLLRREGPQAFPHGQVLSPSYCFLLDLSERATGKAGGRRGGAWWGEDGSQCLPTFLRGPCV